MTKIEKIKNNLEYYKYMEKYLSARINEAKDTISEIENRLADVQHKIYEIKIELENAEIDNAKSIEFKVGCGFINIKEHEEFSLIVITTIDEMYGVCGIKYKLRYFNLENEDASIDYISRIYSEKIKSYRPITECEVDALLKLFLRKDHTLYSIEKVDEFLTSIRGK